MKLRLLKVAFLGASFFLAPLTAGEHDTFSALAYFLEQYFLSSNPEFTPLGELPLSPEYMFENEREFSRWVQDKTALDELVKRHPEVADYRGAMITGIQQRHGQRPLPDCYYPRIPYKDTAR